MSAEWLHWYYLIYLLPASVAVLVLLMSGLGGHHAGHGHGAHSGLHLHAHHSAAPVAGHGAQVGQLHAGAHAGPAAGGHHAAAHGHGSHGRVGVPHGQHSSPTASRQLLGFFGVGRAPLTIVVGSLLIGWGLFGLAATETLRPLLRLPAVFVLPSMGIAGAGALLTAKLFGELAARVMPQDETYALSRDGLLGLTGKVVFPISESGGRVHVYDQFHTLHVASARVAPGCPPIERGTEIIIASTDPDHRYLIVEPLGFTTGRKPLP